MAIGSKLKEVRTALGYTQEYVADELKVSRQTLSNWENEKTYPDILNPVKLSDLYDISLDEMVKGDARMIKHLDDSTNTVKSNRKLAIAGVAVLVILFLTIVIGEGIRPDNLGSGNVPSEQGISIWPIVLDGMLVVKLSLLILAAAVFCFIAYLVKVGGRKRSGGDVPLRTMIKKKDIFCLLAIILIMVGSFLILW